MQTSRRSLRRLLGTALVALAIAIGAFAPSPTSTDAGTLLVGLQPDVSPDSLAPLLAGHADVRRRIPELNLLVVAPRPGEGESTLRALRAQPGVR